MLGHRNGQFSPIPSLTGSILEPCEGDTGYKKAKTCRSLSSEVEHLYTCEMEPRLTSWAKRDPRGHPSCSERVGREGRPPVWEVPFRTGPCFGQQHPLLASPGDTVPAFPV